MDNVPAVDASGQYAFQADSESEPFLTLAFPCRCLLSVTSTSQCLLPRAVSLSAANRRLARILEVCIIVNTNPLPRVIFWIRSRLSFLLLTPFSTLHSPLFPYSPISWSHPLTPTSLPSHFVETTLSASHFNLQSRGGGRTTPFPCQISHHRVSTMIFFLLPTGRQHPPYLVSERFTSLPPLLMSPNKHMEYDDKKKKKKKKEEKKKVFI